MPTNASWANPIEAQFGPLRTSVMSNSDYRNHPTLQPASCRPTCASATPPTARYPHMLAAQRRVRHRIRSERQQRWGRPKPKVA